MFVSLENSLKLPDSVFCILGRGTSSIYIVALDTGDVCQPGPEKEREREEEDMNCVLIGCSSEQESWGPSS